MEWGKGQLTVLEGGRSVRVRASKDTDTFLLEFVTPLSGEVESAAAEIEGHRAAKVRLSDDGKVMTVFTLSPESFHALLHSSLELVRRIAEEA